MGQKSPKQRQTRSFVKGQFILLVQTVVLGERDQDLALGALEAAMELPDGCHPTTYRAKQAVSFVKWLTEGFGKPKWVPKDWEPSWKKEA